MRRLLASFLALGCAVGCGGRPAASPGSDGPYFISKNASYADPGSRVALRPLSKSGYSLSRRCAQGPLELVLPALGSAHGEYVWIELRGPRHVAGEWKASVPGTEGYYQSTFTTGDKEENERCVAPEQQVTVAAPPGSGGDGSGAGTPHGGGGGGAPSGGGEIVVFRPAQLPATPSGRAGFTIVVRSDAQVTAGASITITLWSRSPQDWEDFVAWVEQGALVPDDVGQWEAGREEEKKKRQQANADSTAKVNRRNACRSSYTANKVMTPECDAEFPGMIEEESAALACWDVWDKQKLWTEACVKLTGLDPRADKPSGPPPAPPPDPQPPKPSVHAEWVPGSFYASGSVWVWSPGLWRVPKEDVDSGQTAKAPSAPPAAPAETPPPKPSPTAVWTPGWWAFSFEGWVWIGGAWRNPPFAGATWRPYAWVAFGAHFTLVPGGWTKP